MPGLAKNLSSVSKLTDKGFNVVFTKEGCKIHDASGFSLVGEHIASVTNVNGAYLLVVVKNETAMVCKRPDDQILRHRRLGHLNCHGLTISLGSCCGLPLVSCWPVCNSA